MHLCLFRKFICDLFLFLYFGMVRKRERRWVGKLRGRCMVCKAILSIGADGTVAPPENLALPLAFTY